MNQTVKDLLERRSCRNFKPDMVAKDVIEQIIEAGLYAPSAVGKQSTMILAVTDKELRDKICKDNREIGGWKEDFDPFYGAPVILVVLGKKDWSLKVYDGSLVMGNLMNAAQALGVDSIWIHRAKEEFERDDYAELLKKLGVEGEWEGIGHCALGYRASDLSAPAPRAPGRVVWAE